MENTKEKSEMSKHLKDLDRENNELLIMLINNSWLYRKYKKEISDLTSEKIRDYKKIK